MSTIVLEAQARADIGKGASRRLRRLENRVPAIIYGGGKKPENIDLHHFHLTKAFEDEKIYASVLNLKLDGKTQRVILKDMQRHAYKPVILHLDFLRVSDEDILVKAIPVHFLNGEEAPGLKEGGVINHNMSQIEVRCAVKDLPAFIEVEIGHLNLNDVIHLSQIKLPAGVALTTDVSEVENDFPVVSIHLPKVVVEEEPVVEAVEGEEGAEGVEGEEGAAEGEEGKPAEGAEHTAPEGKEGEGHDKHAHNKHHDDKHHDASEKKDD